MFHDNALNLISMDYENTFCRLKFDHLLIPC